MPYFDFHMHPTLKAMFSAPPHKTSPWVDIDNKKIPWLLRWCSEFQDVLGSQSNLRQLLDNKVNLVCIALLIPDPGMLANDLLMQQAAGTLSVYLNADRLKAIVDGSLKPYPFLVDEDLDVLLHPEQFGITDKKVVVLKNKADYNPNSTDTLYVVFSIEGCHTLSSTLDSSTINVDEVLANLDDLCKKVPVISLNITHIESFPFCNQAFGILFVDDPRFKPSGNKLSNEGVQIMKHCYERNILIDLKHTSLGARRMMIEDVRNRMEFKDINQPLVCTHAGFTGLSYNDIPAYIRDYDPAEHRLVWAKPRMYSDGDDIAFNPSSINLYDEDILAILQTGGLIGLSLDKRILGYGLSSNPNPIPEELAEETEFISPHEQQFFIFKNELGEKVNEQDCITALEVMNVGQVNPMVAAYQLKHFMAHVLHVFFVAEKHGYSKEQTMQQICLGSDFDGLINPIWCCETITQIDSFKSSFIKVFPGFAKANKKKVSLPASFEIKKFAEQLFFENGKNFTLERIEKVKA